MLNQFSRTELLLGKGNPSGKLTDTFAASLDDYPSTSKIFMNPVTM